MRRDAARATHPGAGAVWCLAVAQMMQVTRLL